MPSRVLVLDDDLAICEVVVDILRGRFDVVTHVDVDAALMALKEEHFAVLITDLWMPGMSGTEVVRRALRERPDLATIVMTGRADLDEFTELLRLGAMDYLLKPFPPEDMLLAVERALQIRQLRVENRRLIEESAAMPAVPELVAESPAMREVERLVWKVAPTDASVLISGESGTGKEVVARAIHALSPRSDGPFVAVHCGAISEGLLDSELFGHARGAFTGADRARRGCFELAAGGTLFLDEVGSMTAATQVRMLRVLAEREIVRVGEARARSVDVRVLAASNVDLRRRIDEGEFREDLYFRLNVVSIRVPTLQERGTDEIRSLSNLLLVQCCARLGKRPKRLGADALAALALHSWPGNVRELENAIERAAIVSGDDEVVEARHVTFGRPRRPREAWQIRLPGDGLDVRMFLSAVEDRLIHQAMDRTGGNRQRAADLLGLKRTALVGKLLRRAVPGADHDTPTADRES